MHDSDHNPAMSDTHSDPAALLQALATALWSEYFLIPLLAVVGIYLTVGLRGYTLTHLPQAFLLTWRGRREDRQESGEISPFQALMTSLAATIGTGNIAGVATAIHFGGPGAVFWMWVIALFGMAAKYAEGMLAVRYREVDALGNFVGGPMYYIRNGLGRRWAWLGACFALSGTIAAFGIGNMVQANSVADIMRETFAVPTWVSGSLMAALTAAVVLGGVQRIAQVASATVPTMALLYIGVSLLVLALNVQAVPGAFALIVEQAFAPAAAGGGAAGAGMWAALRWGFARGIFSNEAGLGSAAIAHAAARTHNAVEQGTIAMLGTFIDTICVCSMTALVIIVTGAWTGTEGGAALSVAAFDRGIGASGPIVIGVALAVFAFTTIVGWAYYGERCAEYLFGVRVIGTYRVLWVLAVLPGALFELELVWAFADIFNALMAVPNLLALVLLSPLVFRLTREAMAAPPRALYARAHPDA